MSNFLKIGNDVSKYQGKIDWAKAKADGCEFAILRAGYGKETRQEDPTFDYNHSECIRLGIPVGAYWYAYWTTTPEDEAKAFLAVISDKRLDMGLWYDVEYEPKITSKDKKTLTDWTIRGLKALEKSGRFVGLYASTDMVNNRMEYWRQQNWALWVAQYNKICTCKAPYGIWQFTSSASLDGVNGRVDENEMYVDYPSIIGKSNALAGGTGAPKPETETPTPPEPTPDIKDPETPHSTSIVTTQPMTRGDLKNFIAEAERLGLYVMGDLEIGPMTGGDLATIEALAEKASIKISIQ